MDLKTIKTQPDKAIITTLVTGVLEAVYPAKQTSHATYGDGISQDAKLVQGSEFLFIEFKNFKQDMQLYQGQTITVQSTSGKHGLNGVKVNRYYSQTAGVERVNVRITPTADLTVGGVSVSASAPPPAATPAQFPPQGSPAVAPQAPTAQAPTVGPGYPPATKWIPAGPSVGAALNNATSLLIAEGNTSPTERELWVKASPFIRVAKELEQGKLAAAVGEVAPPPVVQAPPPVTAPQPVRTLPPAPSDAQVRSEGFFDQDEDMPF